MGPRFAGEFTRRPGSHVAYACAYAVHVNQQALHLYFSLPSNSQHEVVPVGGDCSVWGGGAGRVCLPGPASLPQEEQQWQRHWVQTVPEAALDRPDVC